MCHSDFRHTDGLPLFICLLLGQTLKHIGWNNGLGNLNGLGLWLCGSLGLWLYFGNDLNGLGNGFNDLNNLNGLGLWLCDSLGSLCLWLCESFRFPFLGSLCPCLGSLCLLGIFLRLLSFVAHEFVKFVLFSSEFFEEGWGIHLFLFSVVSTLLLANRVINRLGDGLEGSGGCFNDFVHYLNYWKIVVYL